MEVFVIIRKVSIPMDGTETKVIGVVSSEIEAKRIVGKLVASPYIEDGANTYYSYGKCELDNILSFDLWDDEEKIKEDLL